MFNATNSTDNIEEEYVLTENELVLDVARYNFGNDYSLVFPITFVVCLFGLVTNTFNVVVFSRRPMSESPVNFFLAIMSLSNLVLLTTQLPYHIHFMLGFRYLFTLTWNRLYITLICIENASLLICNWLAVTVGIFRNIAIKCPLRSRTLCSMGRARKAVMVIVLSAFAISLPSYAFLTCEEYFLYNKTLYSKGYTEFALRSEGAFLMAYWGSLLLVVLVPCLLLIGLTLMLLHALATFKRERTQTFRHKPGAKESKLNSQSYRMTAMLTLLLFLFVLSNLPDASLVVAVFFSGGDETLREKAKRATDLIRVFSLFNNAGSFFIYFFMGKNFRSSYHTIFCCVKPPFVTQRTQPSTADTNQSEC